MAGMVKQVISTETSKTEILMTLKELLTSEVIKEGTPGINETTYASAWDEEEIELLKAKIFETVSRL